VSAVTAIGVSRQVERTPRPRGGSVERDRREIPLEPRLALALAGTARAQIGLEPQRAARLIAAEVETLQGLGSRRAVGQTHEQQARDLLVAHRLEAGARCVDPAGLQEPDDGLRGPPDGVVDLRLRLEHRRVPGRERLSDEAPPELADARIPHEARLAQRRERLEQGLLRLVPPRGLARVARQGHEQPRLELQRLGLLLRVRQAALGRLTHLIEAAR
jgi:hypothetical protein